MGRAQFSTHLSIFWVLDSLCLASTDYEKNAGDLRGQAWKCGEHHLTNIPLVVTFSPTPIPLTYYNPYVGDLI